MLRIGDKVTIQTDDAFEKKKHLLNGHICVITDIIDRTHLFPSMDPQLHIIYGIYWFPEDNPDRNSVLRRNVISNYWYDDDYDLFCSSKKIQKPYSEILPLV